MNNTTLSPTNQEASLTWDTVLPLALVTHTRPQVPPSQKSMSIRNSTSLRRNYLSLLQRPDIRITTVIIVLLVISSAIFGIINYQHYIHMQDIKGTATATTALTYATATAITIANNPYPTYLSDNRTVKGTLRLLDPLTNHLQWSADMNNNSGTSCEYRGGAFHVKDKTFESYNVCPSDFDAFSNFAIEVHAMMIHYGCEGITFRASYNKYYMFTICQNQTGSYCKLLKYLNSSTNTFSALLPTKRLMNNMLQWNVITIRAIRSQINLYINQILIKSIVDSDYNIGYIGFLAQNLSDNSEVAYSNARIWSVS